jgi:hypothetical protein
MDYCSKQYWQNARNGWTRIVWATPDLCVFTVEKPRWWLRYLKKIGDNHGRLWIFLGRVHLGIRV